MRDADAGAEDSSAGDGDDLGVMQETVKDRRGAGAGKLTERQYHDTVLRQGPMPIELLRAALTGTKLPKDAEPSWRFAK